MSDRRTGAAGGLVFAVLSVAAIVVMPPPPAADATAATLRHYFASDSTAIRTASAVSALAALALLPLFATLRRRLASTAGDTLSAAGVVTVTVSIIGAVLQSALVNTQARLSDDGLRTFFGIERGIFYIAPAIAVTMVGAAAAAAYRESMPRWLAAGSGLLGVVALAGGVSTMVTDATAAGALGLAGFLLTIAWSAATGIVMLRESVAATTPSTTSAAVATG